MQVLNQLIEDKRDRRIRAYREESADIKEHCEIEAEVLAGGYAHRQLLELVQNGADAISDAVEFGATPVGPDRIDVMLANHMLYVANTGAPLTKDGIESLLQSHSSPKKGNQIGRFGLGFKSLLKLGGKIDMISTSAAMRFDPKRCREELRAEFGGEDLPGLRLAWALDRKHEFDNDVILQRYDWATTVVRAEVCSDALMEHLREEIKAFPVEFLLFPRAEFGLRLDNGRDAFRILTRKPNSRGCTLFDGTDESHWRVVSKQGIEITDALAIQNATKIHARGAIDISWATPLDMERPKAGLFWAFFPTRTITGMTGILNAPWKLTPDRSALIPGPWNDRLMSEAADIIVKELPAIATSEDCGKHLDAFPRQLDPGETATHLVEEVWKRIEAATIIPNMLGSMCAPLQLSRHPWDFHEINTAWGETACPEDLGCYVHPNCLGGDRGSRLEKLAKRIESALGKDSSEGLELPNLRRKPEIDWFDAIASEEIEGAIRVLQLARDVREEISGEKWKALRPLLSIIPTVVDGLKPPDQVLFAPPETEIPGKSVVAEALAMNPVAKTLATEVMEVGSLDEDGWTDLLDQALKGAHKIPTSWPRDHWEENRLRNARWSHFWSVLRSSPENLRLLFIDKHAAEIRVQRQDGQWLFKDYLLLPGGLIDINDPENREHLVHPTFHKDDTKNLGHLGVASTPSLNWQPWLGRSRFDGIGEIFNLWLEVAREAYRSGLPPDKHKAQSSKFVPDEFSMPDGWHFLSSITGRSNSVLTAKLLALISSGDFKPQVIFYYSRRTGSSIRRDEDYPRMPFQHPILWLLMKYGSFRIGESTIRLATVVSHRNKPATTLLPKWSDIQIALDLIGKCSQPPAASDDENIKFWNAMFKTVVTQDGIDNDQYQDLWDDAASHGIVPTDLPDRDRPVSLTETYVTSSRDLARHARDGNRMVVTVGQEALQLWLSNGALDLSEILTPIFDSAIGPVASLDSVIPELDAVLKLEASTEQRFCGNCQIVSGLRFSTDENASAIPCLLWDGVLLIDDDQMACLSRSDQLHRILSEISGAGWLGMDAEAAFRKLFDQAVDDRRQRVAAADSLSARLLLAVGNRVEPLRLALGSLRDKPFLDFCSPQELSELVLNLLGPTTLSNLEEALKQEGLNPPTRWNTADAREFVAGIGFPVEFAISPKASREAEEVVSGPIPLPDLHEYQVEVYDGIQNLISSGNGRRRAVVCLPTGGGKTRVVVQAAVDLVLKPEGERRSVLWVAQTDELCEQAVQAFQQVWINRGAINTPLRIARLWGGKHKNPAAPLAGQPVVVVASIQTLNNRIGDLTAQWLSKPGIWVVDECHHAITKSYSRVLRWLDAEVPGTAKEGSEEPPIIGLSATPFRGGDDDESVRLAKRFDDRWFPKNQSALYDRLRSQGVLSIADHESLESAATLTGEELEKLEKLGAKWDGVDLDNIIEGFNQRLAGDEERNEMLLARLQNAVEKSILFFGNSVEHSEEIAARLCLRGIRAVPISYKTPTAARRQFLDQFQRGIIRVLCNHSALVTGFDAPKIDMVLIARQVYSPVRYMQMVGRGLRGVENGGTERCKIVTVMDNLGRFQSRHPFHYCARFFSEQ